MSSRSRSRQQVGCVINALAHDTPSRESRTAAGRIESDRGSNRQLPLQRVLDRPHELRSTTPAAESSGGDVGPSLLPSVRGLNPAPKCSVSSAPKSPFNPASKCCAATLSPLRSPASAAEAARRTPAPLAEDDAHAIEEFRDKFIKSGAIKFASLREAFRKIDANKNGALRAAGSESGARCVSVN
jgi:hypothetical protein